MKYCANLLPARGASGVYWRIGRDILDRQEHAGWGAKVIDRLSADLRRETGYLKRIGKAVNNFPRTLPKPQSDLANQTLKDPYMLDFLELSGDVSERRLERALVEKLRSFLLELGVGFAFVGTQVHLEVDGEDFYLDMLFYHLRLRCYIVVELKTTTFRPEYAGKLQFYLSARGQNAGVRMPSAWPSA